MRVNQLTEILKVNADATYVLEYFAERQALSNEGAQMIGKFAQSVNKDLETLEILEAYTLKTDGRKVQVGSNGLLVQQGLASGGTGVSWPGVEIHQLTFPDVQKGDKTIWRMRISTLKPQLPGWMAFSDFGIPGVLFDHMSVQVEAPSAMKLQVFADKFSPKRIESKDGRDVWQYEFQQKEVRLQDARPANILVSFPRVYVSTHADPAQLATLFNQTLMGKVKANAEISRLATQITAGKTGDWEKAAAIHDWVRNNIRYVAVFLGTGGWQPHDLDWILKNRYGDCKDHVLLMMAMLHAIGIEAVPALVNSMGDEYQLPEVALGFNHVIVYLPALKTFADPTDARIPFGALPWSDADKPVAVAIGAGQVMRTPHFLPTTERLHTRTHWVIAKSGKASGEIALSAQGFAATLTQDRLSQIPAGFSEKFVQKILQSSQLSGSGSVEYPPVQRYVQEQRATLKNLEVDKLIADPSGGAINPHPQLQLPLYIARLMGDSTAPSRSYAAVCAPINVREDFELTFDPAYQLIRIPADIHERHPDGIQFDAQYLRTGNTVSGWRELTLSQGRHVCSPEQYAARQPVLQRIALHLRSSILFQQ